MADATDDRPADHPEPGFFLFRLVRGGPQMAAQIVHANGQWQAVIDGEPELAPDPDPYRAPKVVDIWLYGQKVTEAEYRYRLQRAAWARENVPDAPEANPRRRIDPRSIPVSALL